MFGICNLSVVAIRVEPKHQSEMGSQLLFGETYEILEKSNQWLKIKTSFDNYIGFIQKEHFLEIDENVYHLLQKSEKTYAGEFISFAVSDRNELITLPLGCELPNFNNQKFEIHKDKYVYDGKVYQQKLPKIELIKIAYSLLNTPYLWGGKTPFGIDCSGFTQLVYKLCGVHLKRDAKNQAQQGEVLSFIEESEVGDLAFFDDEQGNITHVGIILNNYQIIHAHGKVRIDTLDHSGIFNAESQKHTHKLRIIKKMM